MSHPSGSHLQGFQNIPGGEMCSVMDDLNNYGRDSFPRKTRNQNPEYSLEQGIVKRKSETKSKGRQPKKKLTPRRKNIISEFFTDCIKRPGTHGHAGSPFWVGKLAKRINILKTEKSGRVRIIKEPVSITDVGNWLRNMEYAKLLNDLKIKEKEGQQPGSSQGKSSANRRSRSPYSFHSSGSSDDSDVTTLVPRNGKRKLIVSAGPLQNSSSGGDREKEASVPQENPPTLEGHQEPSTSQMTENMDQDAENLTVTCPRRNQKRRILPVIDNENFAGETRETLEGASQEEDAHRETFPQPLNLTSISPSFQGAPSGEYRIPEDNTLPEHGEQSGSHHQQEHGEQSGSHHQQEHGGQSGSHHQQEHGGQSGSHHHEHEGQSGSHHHEHGEQSGSHHHEHGGQSGSYHHENGVEGADPGLLSVYSPLQQDEDSLLRQQLLQSPSSNSGNFTPGQAEVEGEVQIQIFDDTPENPVQPVPKPREHPEYAENRGHAASSDEVENRGRAGTVSEALYTLHCAISTARDAFNDLIYLNQCVQAPSTMTVLGFMMDSIQSFIQRFMNPEQVLNY